MSDRGTLAPTEPHPSAEDAYRFVAQYPLEDLMLWRGSFASCAIEGNRLAEVCHETLRRVMDREPVSDRYILGLAWAMRGRPGTPLLAGEGS